VTASLAGCTTFMSSARSPVSERCLAEGLLSLQSGNLRLAHELFECVVNEPAVDKITDEALFRLALLQLGEDGRQGRFHEPRHYWNACARNTPGVPGLIRPRRWQPGWLASRVVVTGIGNMSTS